MEQPTPTQSDLQFYLVGKFTTWRPSAPAVVTRRKGDITLDWGQKLFSFLGDQLIYRLEKNDKIPKWIVVYSGGKTIKRIDDLAPRYPHRFRVKVILKTTAVAHLAELALNRYGNQITIYEQMETISKELDDNQNENNNSDNSHHTTDDRKDSDKFETYTIIHANTEKEHVKIDNMMQVVEAIKLAEQNKKTEDDILNTKCDRPPWLESLWSSETWSNTDTDGTSPVCFGMAVKCGYLKQVELFQMQVMVEERPELLEIVNTSTGHTPLATAVKKGDINTVRLLITLGAEVNQPSLAGQTPLQLAVLAGDVALVDLLLEKGADMKAQDCNGLRAEHYAVDSGNQKMVCYILDRGGDLGARDNNGWTPLFRALCEGVCTSIVEELVTRGSDLNIVDNAGLPLLSVAKLLKNRHGRPRDSVLSLVDGQHPHEKAIAHFTRITKKIYNVHTLLNMK